MLVNRFVRIFVVLLFPSACSSGDESSHPSGGYEHKVDASAARDRQTADDGAVASSSPNQEHHDSSADQDAAAASSTERPNTDAAVTDETNRDAGSERANRMDDIKLPESAFVFVKSFTSGDHLFYFDTATHTEHLISSLDDTPAIGTTAAHGTQLHANLSLSPDRRWVAFAAFFRSTPLDLANTPPRPALWKVSTDGLVFVRLTKPVVAPPTAFNLTIRDARYPVWSPDGSTLYFENLYAGTDPSTGSIAVQLGAVVGTDGTGIESSSGVASECALQSGFDIDAKGQNAALFGADCTGQNNAFTSVRVLIWSFKTKQSAATYWAKTLSDASSELELDGPGPQWLPDGSGLLFMRTLELGKLKRQALSLLTLADGNLKTIFTPSSTRDLHSFALAPNGEDLVLAINEYDNTNLSPARTNLWATTLAGASTLTQLTTEGGSAWPKFP